MVARQVPDDPYWPEVIFAPQIKHFVNDLSGRLIGWVLGNRLGVTQTSFTMLLVCVTPPIKAGPADAKIPAEFAGIADLLRVLKHLKFELNVAFLVRNEYFLHPKSWNVQEVSRESVHIYIRCLSHLLRFGCTSGIHWIGPVVFLVHQITHAIEGTFVT